MSPSSPSLRAPSTLILTGLLLVGSTWLSGCASDGPARRDKDEVRTSIRTGHFEDGIRHAQALLDEDPNNAELAELHRVATIGLYLQRGRESTFANKDLTALHWFGLAEEIAPASEMVAQWIGKTKSKLADHWLHVGAEAFATEDYPAASEAYRNVLEHIPGHPQALSGLGQVMLVMNYQRGLGLDYYNSGVRALSEYYLERARRGFNVTQKYLPKMKRAVTRKNDVDILLAEQRVTVATGLEGEKLFAAALSEYRFASVLDEGNQEALAGIERVSIEERAAQILRDAEMKLYRDQFDEAEELLARGEAMTSVQHEEFEASRGRIAVARFERLYEVALTLEHDRSFDQAIVAYGDLLDQVEYFRDARARKATLEGYVEMAAKYYDQAMAAKGPEKKLEYLQSISGFWPDYKNIEKLIEKLEGK